MGLRCGGDPWSRLEFEETAEIVQRARPWTGAAVAAEGENDQ